MRALSHELTLENYLAQKHVAFSPGGQTDASNVDDYLRRRGLRRMVAFTVAHLLEIPSILMATDWVVTGPARGIYPMANHWDVTIRELPFELTPIEVLLLWHRRVSFRSGPRLVAPVRGRTARRPA